jgi:hypothetical protein
MTEATTASTNATAAKPAASPFGLPKYDGLRSAGKWRHSQPVEVSVR